MSVIRLLLAHELGLPRAALKSLLSSDLQLDVVAEADNVESLTEQIRTAPPDVLLLTLSPHAGFGRALIESLARINPQVRIVVLSPQIELSFVRLLMAAGASGYVCERSPVTELRVALQEVMQGRTFIDTSVTDRPGSEPLGKPKHAPNRLNPSSLSKRETEVLQMLAQGFTNQQVADALSLSVKTAETYRVRLTRKLGMKSRAELFRYAFEVGLIGPDQLS